LQKVHSKLHIIASIEFGANFVLQCSHVGRSASIYSL
jgi:hypothetical protein